MKIIIASNNLNKIKEIKSLLDPKIELLSLNDVSFYDEILENGTTFLENALIKAKTIYDIYKIPTIADDSGLCVEALNLAPGVYSHRYASDLCDDDLNNKKLVKELQGIENRRAYYECVICYYDGKAHFTTGRCYGTIKDEPKGDMGFGYDPHFYIEELGKMMAEITLTEKNQISHRAKAVKEISKKLNELLNSIG